MGIPNKLSLAVCAAVLASFLASNASAQTVTFNSLMGINGAPFPSPYTENGLTVTSVSGVWQEAQLFGNGTPSIFSSSGSAAIKVTSGGTFVFASVDLGDALGFLGPSYTIEGLLGAASVFTMSGPDIAAGFTTISSSSSALIDSLVITMDKVQTSSYNIDNIVVREVSVPDAASTFGMLLAGLGALPFARRFRA